MYVGITTSEGKPFTGYDDLIVGYQIEHKQTGRRLPRTQPFEVFTEKAAEQRMQEVDIELFFLHNLNIGINDYVLVPIGRDELNEGWHLVTIDEDWME